MLPAKRFELLGSSPLFVFFYLLLHYSVVILHYIDLWLTDLFLTSNKIPFDLIWFEIYIAALRQSLAIEIRRFFLPHAVCLWLFCLCMKYLWNRWTNLCQIHAEDVPDPSLGRVRRSRVKGQGHQVQKLHFRPFWRPSCGLCLVKHL